MCMYVRPLPEVRRRGGASPLTSYVTKRGHTVVVLSYNKVRARGGAATGSRRVWLGMQRRSRLGNYRTPLDYRARPGPGLRRTAVATAAERLPVCTCRARQTACWLIQVNSRGDRARAANTSARQTSVAFAARRKQNTAQKSDHQPEPLPTTTPVSWARPSPPASWCGSRDYI